MLVTPTSKRISGFTIVELMVTVAIAGILLAVAVPSFNQMTVNSRLTAQANDMVGALNLARSEAIKRNTRVSFCRATSETATTCATSAAAWTNWIVMTGSGNVIRRGVVNTTAGAIFVRSTLTTDAVTFGPEGLARTGTSLVADQRITVCAARNQGGRRVTLGRGSRLITTAVSGTCAA